MDGPPLSPKTNFKPLASRGSLRLTGKYVNIIPLSPSQIHDLYNAIGGPENAYLWTYTNYGPFLTLADFTDFINSITSEHAYSIVRLPARPSPSSQLQSTSEMSVPQGHVVGIVLSMPDFNNGVNTAGLIVTSAEILRTPVITETLFLILSDFFAYGFRRMEWQCNSLNASSRRAALRLGFTYEGTSRDCEVVKGRLRSTDWFSILEGEWAAKRDALAIWLNDSNFDRMGRERQSLRMVQEDVSGAAARKAHEQEFTLSQAVRRNGGLYY